MRLGDFHFEIEVDRIRNRRSKACVTVAQQLDKLRVGGMNADRYATDSDDDLMLVDDGGQLAHCACCSRGFANAARTRIMMRGIHTDWRTIVARTRSLKFKLRRGSMR